MDKRVIHIAVILTFFTLILTFGWWFAGNQFVTPENTPSQLPTVHKQEDRAVAAQEVIEAMEASDLERALNRIHPDKGVRLTPYTNVDVQSNIVITKDQIRGIAGNQEIRNTIFTWGTYDGSGDPIELDFAEYFDRFIYDEPYINAPTVRWNQIVQYGNAIDNAAQVYSGAQIIEYHFPSIDPQYEGMDWRSLRLVFEQFRGQWYLVGIIHDEWTI